jgi:hypothetical protein
MEEPTSLSRSGGEDARLRCLRRAAFLALPAFFIWAITMNQASETLVDLHLGNSQEPDPFSLIYLHSLSTSDDANDPKRQDGLSPNQHCHSLNSSLQGSTNITSDWMLRALWGTDESPFVNSTGFCRQRGKHPISLKAFERSYSKPSPAMFSSWDRVIAALDAGLTVSICVIGGSSE